jgi:hypothetical protein
MMLSSPLSRLYCLVFSIAVSCLALPCPVFPVFLAIVVALILAIFSILLRIISPVRVHDREKRATMDAMPFQSYSCGEDMNASCRPTMEDALLCCDRFYNEETECGTFASTIALGLQRLSL